MHSFILLILTSQNAHFYLEDGTGTRCSDIIGSTKIEEESPYQSVYEDKWPNCDDNPDSYFFAILITSLPANKKAPTAYTSVSLLFTLCGSAPIG